MLKLVFIGFGNVGRSLAQILIDKKKLLKERYGSEFKVVGIGELYGSFVNKEGLNLEDLVDLSFSDFENHKNWKKGLTAPELIKNLDFDVLVEMSYTNLEDGEPGLTYIREALKNGHHIVSSNKGPFVFAFQELQDLAREGELELKYEATVGGAIPIFNLGMYGLASNEIFSIRAILNGTSNFILTKMSTEKIPFEIALKEAQELGYAEADPTLDIEGHDAAAKLVILANTFLGSNVSFKNVKIQGIKDIVPDAIALASEDDFLIKHIAIADKKGNLEVAPKLVPFDSPFAIGGTNNIIVLETDLAKHISIIGHGAGGSEAASAIMSDLVSISIKEKK
ncbi:MAG: homoserine dehydrogenase [Candidatus Lokiarchaeota archaeon]|nr:homoserine dehydrogenase [Candidatus Lokiarchaeota archaeon]